ncbi:hypothetical protein CPT_Sycamore_068 [Streptomyces phage Sycamore]|uniref:Uncharacterized protein n=1 Tax=Streptomyces phage Sycamore TaxID=2767589 RepID=A0A873WKT2_9CAUD|nr:hypothetical protein CPT_Sycamore_068 [Streptomyces phage Sycamore]
MPAYTPKLTNAKGTPAVTTLGQYAVSGGVVTFTAQVNAKGLVESVNAYGFGLTLPVPAVSGIRHTFNLEFDGRDADNGAWTGEALIYAGSDGSQLDRLRVTGTSNGAALQNVTFLYGNSEGAVDAEIITVTGSYVAA